jgi:SagB-type dehydrogenase family enzyme
MEKELQSRYRFFLKDSIRKLIDFSRTDQNRGIEPPPVEKPYSDAAQKIELVKPGAWQEIGNVDLAAAIGLRRSRRLFKKKPLSLEELSFLLWAVQGLREQPVSCHAFRTVPSAGCRHALETYLAVFHVQDLEPGLYRYLPLSHQLLLEHSPPDLSEKTIKAAFGQSFTGQSAVTFIWTALPYRMEWRYDLAAHKVIAIDAGHVCQNLYLACEAIKAGTCAIAAYDQEEADALLGVDGEEEFVIYMAPVGKI